MQAHRFRLRHASVVASLALLGWALCAAVMGIGMAVASLQTALIVHAAAAPLIFAAISAIYFRLWGNWQPFAIAAAFLAVVMFMDVFVVAMLVQDSFEMFRSFAGTWLPFALIFGATYLAGAIMRPGARGTQG